MKQPEVFVDHYLAYLLARASHLISSQFHAVVEKNGLSLLEWRVMASLWGQNPLSIGELAEIVLAKQPTLTKLVGRMSEAGWVRRVDSVIDKRQSLVSLTEQGVRITEPLIAKAKAHEADIVGPLGTANIDQLKMQLIQMIEIHKAKRPTEW
jgi:DNA-binding MarR family transcriptional regulator